MNDPLNERPAERHAGFAVGRSGTLPDMFKPMPKDARVYVAGHGGLVGSAVVRRLEEGGFTNVLSATRRELDLRDQGAVNEWFEANRPDYVFLVAGTVGGILANSTRPAEFIYDNLMIHGTVVHASDAQSLRQQPDQLDRLLGVSRAH